MKLLFPILMTIIFFLFQPLKEKPTRTPKIEEVFNFISEGYLYAAVKSLEDIDQKKARKSKTVLYYYIRSEIYLHKANFFKAKEYLKRAQMQYNGLVDKTTEKLINNDLINDLKERIEICQKLYNDFDEEDKPGIFNGNKGSNDYLDKKDLETIEKAIDLLNDGKYYSSKKMKEELLVISNFLVEINYINSVCALNNNSNVLDFEKSAIDLKKAKYKFALINKRGKKSRKVNQMDLKNLSEKIRLKEELTDLQVLKLLK